MNTPRLPRLEQLIQEQIGSLIVTGKVKDPRVDAFLSITHVKVSRDIAFADVFVSSYKTPEGLKKGVDGLQRAAGFIQAKLNEQLRLRHIPRLRFHADPGLREAFALGQKLDGLIRRDSSGAPLPSPENPLPSAP